MIRRFILPFPGEGNGAAPAAPAAGSVAALSGEGGQIVVMPDTGASTDNRSAVEKASDAYRQRLAETGTALPTPPGTQQPRRADGTFRPAPSTGAPPEPETPEQTAARESEEAAARAQEELRLATETPEQKAAREAAATAAAQEAAPAEGDEPALTPEQEAERAERVVELKLGDEATPIEFDDPEVARNVREALTIADRADEIVTRAESQIEEVMMVRDAITIDPVGFVLGEIGEDVGAIEHLVLSLVTDPKHAALLDKVKGIVGDPAKLQLTAAEQRAARAEFKDQRTHLVTEQKAVRQNYRQVEAVVRAITPSDATPEIKAVAFQDMMMDLKAYAERNNLMTIRPEDIPMILARRLAALRVDPVAASKLANEAINRPPSRASARGVAPARVRSARTTEPAKPGVPAPAARKPGSAFVASAERRKATAIPGGGAGSPGTPATLVPPLNSDGSKMTIEQTTAWHRSRLARGVKSY